MSGDGNSGSDLPKTSDALPIAYAAVRKDHQKILGTKEETSRVAVGLVVTDPRNLTGSGFVTKESQPTKPDKTHLMCDHCGMPRHTKEQCFRLSRLVVTRKARFRRKGNQPAPVTGRKPEIEARAMVVLEGSMNKEEDDFLSCAGTGVERETLKNPSLSNK